MEFLIPLILGGAVPIGTELVMEESPRRVRWPSNTPSKTSTPHSNWVELNVAAASQSGPSPAVPTCDPATLPAGLYTGFYDPGLVGDGGCRPEVHAGFAQCHTT